MEADVTGSTPVGHPKNERSATKADVLFLWIAGERVANRAKAREAGSSRCENKSTKLRQLLKEATSMCLYIDRRALLVYNKIYGRMLWTVVALNFIKILLPIS